ncbi:hypothetical protein [Brevundimonas vesicularis]|nr:hypothetical protein [Brevundimonas vesicularis]
MHQRDLFIEPTITHSPPLNRRIRMARGKPLERTAPVVRKSALANDVTALAQIVRVFEQLAKAMPTRVSIRQAYAFLHIAERTAGGHDIIVSDLKALGDDAWGAPLFDASIGRSYQLFMDEPSRDYPEPLGWLRLETDPADKRRKLLRMTAAGEAMAKKLVKIRDESQHTS